MTVRQPQVARWEKDGRWHYTERYEPTALDRERFPVSYPAGNPGPFYRWATDSFDTEREAREAMDS
jgi:hypothetical protein